MNHARVGFILSFLLFSLITLDFAKVSSLNSAQPQTKAEKANLSAVVDNLGKVLNESTGSYFYKFYLKDQTGTAINTNSSAEKALIQGATVTVTSKSSFHCGDSGSDYTFAEHDTGLYKIICQESGLISIRISKSGYNTKNTTLAVYSGEIPTIYLTRYVAPPPPPPPETIKNINLPSTFKEEGSETTDLSKVGDPAKVEGLTLDTKINKIKFNETVDLSADDTKNKFKSLDDYVIADQVGVVGIDSVNLSVLNKKASLTMKGLSFVKTPKVLVDGKENKAVVSNIKYSKGTLTFDVTHFSTFSVAPTVGINEPANNFETKDKSVTLKGTVSDPTASVSAKLNSKDLGKLKVATTGAFSKEVELTEGTNKLVVTALGSTGAVVSATVSGTLIKATLFNSMPFYVALSILALAAAFGLIYFYKKMRKGKVVPPKTQSLPPIVPLTNPAAPTNPQNPL